MKRQYQIKQHGVSTLDYVMVLAVVLPLAFMMLRLMVNAFTSIYEFMTATVGWCIL
jgi:hypothetical protein